MGFGRYDLVKMVVLPGFSTSSLDVFENGFLTVLADFDEFESVLDFDIASFQFFLEESVTAIIVLHKSLVGIDHGERPDRRQSAVSFLPFPNSL